MLEANNTMNFTCELTEHGILYKPAPKTEADLPNWLNSNSTDH